METGSSLKGKFHSTGPRVIWQEVCKQDIANPDRDSSRVQLKEEVEGNEHKVHFG